MRSAESRPAMVPLYERDRYTYKMKTRTHPTCVLAPHHQPTTHPRAMERQTEHAVPPIPLEWPIAFEMFLAYLRMVQQEPGRWSIGTVVSSSGAMDMKEREARSLAVGTSDRRAES